MHKGAIVGGVAAALAVAAMTAEAVPQPFGGERPFTMAQLPAGRLRQQLTGLPAVARDRALERLNAFSFPAEDLASLHADREGGIFYVCPALPRRPAAAVSETAEPVTVAASVPVSPFPASLKFHSRPGAPNVIFLDFDGHVVTGTAWNSSEGRDPFTAVAFSTDGDYANYSDAEQAAIKRIWQRVAEDYAPFNVDVTTEQPAVMGNRTARALITRSTDSGGLPNPADTAGGVAYVDVFGGSSYAYYSPAWVYVDNLSYGESYIAEAATHEVGHNLGLSHDGQTGGVEYYGGHGSGDTSWAPIMGVGYDQNVTQWSKGEYYQANNSEDDLAILAAYLSYRVDDTGDASAPGALVVASNGAVRATTPETDPGNTNGANKGVIERSTDWDVYSFTAGAGTIRLVVNPWISPAGTRGGNLDVQVRLTDAGGALLATNAPAAQTYAVVQSVVTGGVYRLHVGGSAVGTPLANPPSGYTAYASIGQYFVTGQVPDASGIVIPPTALLVASNITLVGQTSHLVRVTYSDNEAVSAASLDNADLRVTGPGGYDRPAAFVGVDVAGDGTPRTATYRVDPPAGTWQLTDNGEYTVRLQSNQVSDIRGAYVAGGVLGTFQCAVPALLYAASMEANPGWTLAGQWAWGVPAGLSGDPSTGYTGTNVVGYNLAGNYARSLTTVYATTPAFSCAGADTVWLTFRRWLGLRSGDTASLQVSTNGTTWSSVWSTTSPVADTNWVLVQYNLSALAARRGSVRLRWGMGSNGDTQVRYGWNLDDVEVTGAGTGLDGYPPAAALSVSNVTLAGGTAATFTVTYPDPAGVSVASLGGDDVRVTGPNAYANDAAFVGVSPATDGTPRTATYRIGAPGGTWNRADNGAYTVALRNGAVTDIGGFAVTGAVLGAFSVDIPLRVLSVSVNAAAAGSVAPTGGVYEAGETATLTATPAPYYRLAGWTGDATGTAAVVQVWMDVNRSVQADFVPLLTTNHPTPLAWLAAQGYGGDFERVVLQAGANGMPVWQSYVAGLIPTNPASVFRVTQWETMPGGGAELGWTTSSGRLYTVYVTASLTNGFVVIPGAVDLHWTNSTLAVPPGPSAFYQLRVRLP
jgi:hypothetical protein